MTRRKRILAIDWRPVAARQATGTVICCPVFIVAIVVSPFLDRRAPSCARERTKLRVGAFQIGLKVHPVSLQARQLAAAKPAETQQLLARRRGIQNNLHIRLTTQQWLD